MTIPETEQELRASPWVCSSNPSVHYRRRASAECVGDRFPIPNIQPRRRRPQSIHILTFSRGFVSYDSTPTRLGQAKTKGAKQLGDKGGVKWRHEPTERVRILVESFLASLRQGSKSISSRFPEKAGVANAVRSPPPYGTGENINESMTRTANMVEVLRPPLIGPHNTNRSSLISVRSAKSAATSLVTELPKPVASGNGVTCSITLAEPNVFLSGFDHDVNTRPENHRGTALLRGKLQIRVSKNVKIRAIQLKLVGKARTEWPEGIPPAKTNHFEESSLRTQVLTFFNAANDTGETEYGNQCSYSLKDCSSANSSSTSLATSPRNSMSFPVISPLTIPGNRNSMPGPVSELRHLSIQSVRSRSFGKGESPLASQAKGYKVFYPGIYEYSFELPIDHHQLETTKLQYASVKWELHANVDRAGAFKSNLHGIKEVSVVRLPDQMSLETSEPISISRQWEDQLYYDIVISGKSFPIGSKIPIAFKLTPLAKVQLHKLKVYVTESIEYWTNDRKVTRKDPGRKVLLLERTAGKPLEPVWDSSEVRITSGGELSASQRQEAREAAAMRRAVEAARLNGIPQPLPEASDNLLGDLDLGLESYWGSTEIEMNVQIPTCETMARHKDMRLNPDCSWKNVNVYHWIKIVLRVSRPDPTDRSGTRRKHFEISIDSPFTVLNCRATQANTNLPRYCGHETAPGQTRQTTCGCPDSASVPCQDSPNSSNGNLASTDAASDLSIPPAVHLMPSASPTRRIPGDHPSDPLGIVQGRPIHLLRVPSYNPPAFDAEEPPPPADTPTGSETTVLMTPPPQYDAVIGTPSVDGLADYFARLADYGYPTFEDSDSDEGLPRLMERNGRVNVANPRTPGGRVPSRSLEISRPPVNLPLQRAAVAGTDVGPGESVQV